MIQIALLFVLTSRQGLRPESCNRSSVSVYKLTAKLFDFARHENPDSWSDLLPLLKF
jgi:hypothetical protein